MEKSQDSDLTNDLELAGEAAVLTESLSYHQQRAALRAERRPGHLLRAGVKARGMATCDPGTGVRGAE